MVVKKKIEVTTMKKRVFESVTITVFLLVLFIGAKADVEDEREVKQFTAFFAQSGTELDENNEIKKLIAEKIGAECKEIWLNYQNEESALNSYIASGEYPDFITGRLELYEADALIPIDEYWEDYPNIRNYLSEEEWEQFRLEDGHIYWMPQFGVVHGKQNDVIHYGEAFWIQTRVLKWAGYPKIRTMDQYFDLIEAYMAANPVMENGTPNIPYTILWDKDRFFCMENAPQFLDGYPNDGSCMVDPDALKVMDYNVTPTAKAYFAKLNEEYHKGIVDPESFTDTYTEYIEKLSTGAVLGMIDQWWDFGYELYAPYSRQHLHEQGCEYVPLPVTIDETIPNQWHVTRSNELDCSVGVSITVSCKDIPGAMQFLNDMLEEEIQILRFWGIEGVDYSVNEDGEFYRTAEQRQRVSDVQLKASHFCVYSYFPRVEGFLPDGINSFSPESQKSEFWKTLSEPMKECLAAYGCETYVDMVGDNEEPGAWYPMYSYSGMLTNSTEAGIAWSNMNETKYTWLPQVVMSEDFEATWAEYMNAYEACEPEKFFADMQQELERRIALAEGKK